MMAMKLKDVPKKGRVKVMVEMEIGRALSGLGYDFDLYLPGRTKALYSGTVLSVFHGILRYCTPVRAKKGGK